MPSTADTPLLNRVPTGLYINGTWRAAANGAQFDVVDPATGQPVLAVADATPQDAVDALDAAAAAQSEWARTPPRERGEILRRAFDIITARADEFAMLIALEMGKPLAEARSEVSYGAEFLRWFSEEAVRISGRYGIAPDGRARLLVGHRPVGPCLLITPWNFPLAMATRKVGPAIAAGCTMALKPAAQTPLTAALFTAVMEEAGLPAGVLNLIQTSDAQATVEPLLAHAALRKLSFTGSTPVGRHLLSRSAQRVLRTSMELGGNAPFIVFADADLDAAVDGAMIAKMRNMGEACTAANRFLVEVSIADTFAERLAGRMRALKVGPGTVPDSDVGPLIDARARDKVAALVSDAIRDGASLQAGGTVIDGAGYFYAPTVLTDVPPTSRIWREEIFGPVATITRFGSEAEAVSLANDTDFGLVAYVYTRDIGRGLRIGERLETGMLGLNAGAVSNPAAPFGGVKQSGLGREGGAEGIQEYLYAQYVGVADPWVPAGDN